MSGVSLGLIMSDFRKGCLAQKCQQSIFIAVVYYASVELNHLAWLGLVWFGWVFQG